MKLIDSTQLILNAKSDKFVTMYEIINAPEIDPIHSLGACYCEECKYHTYDVEGCTHYCNRPLGGNERKNNCNGG